MKTTKKDIVKYIYEHIKESNPDFNLEIEDIRYAVNVLIDIIKEYVADNNTIEIRYFGTFIPKKRKGRIARVPQKGGEEVLLEERYVPVLKFSSIFKEELNKNLIKQKGEVLDNA